MEHQLSGSSTGGIHVACFRPRNSTRAMRVPQRARAHRTRELGVGAGARIAQRIYPDPFGIDTWDTSPTSIVHLHLLDADDYRAITGETAPPSPIDAATYTRFGLPWFAVFDQERGDLDTPDRLKDITSVDAGNKETPITPAAVSQKIRPVALRSRRKK